MMISALQDAGDGYSPEIGRNNHSPVYVSILHPSEFSSRRCHLYLGSHIGQYYPGFDGRNAGFDWNSLFSQLAVRKCDANDTDQQRLLFRENIDSTEAQEPLLGRFEDPIKLGYHFCLHCLGDNQDKIPSGNRLDSIMQAGSRRKHVDVLCKKSLPSVEDESEPSEASSDEVALADSNHVDHNINDIIAAETPERKAVVIDFTLRSSMKYTKHTDNVESYHRPSAMSTDNILNYSYQVCVGTFHH